MVSALKSCGGTGWWGASQKSAGDSTQHKTPPSGFMELMKQQVTQPSNQTVHQKSKFNLMSTAFLYQFMQTVKYIFFFIILVNVLGDRGYRVII